MLRRATAYFAAMVFALAPLAANAGGLIRDAEIEHTLRLYADPIFTVADITPSSVRLLIVQDPTINAYVAGGLNMFLHTGLIRAATKPSMLIGVMAHETGHIAGAHLSQMSEKSSRATLGAAIGALLGVAAVLSGASQAGGGILAGSQSMAQRQFIGDIRLNENSADQAALTFLDSLDYSASGMLEMFETLRRQEAGAATRLDPFLRDHPLTSDRITAMQNHIAQRPMKEDGLPSSFAMLHARMEAKLAGFTDSYEQVQIEYPPSDTSLPARYARAIAEFKHHNVPAALSGMRALIKENPSDAFFYDTLGQILFESGQVKEANAAYANATRLMPSSALILTDYARTFTAQNKPELLPRATNLLEQSVTIDDSYDVTWRELAVAYGKQGKLGQSYMALAEEAELNGDYKTALQHLARAREHAKDDPVLSLKLDDLEHDAKAQLKAEREEKSF